MCKPPFLHHPRCLFFIWVIWSAQIPPSSATAHSSNFVLRSSPFLHRDLRAWEKFFFFFFFPEISNTLDFLAFFVTIFSCFVCDGNARNDTLLTRFFKYALIDSLNVRVFAEKIVGYSRGEPPLPLEYFLSKKRERIVIRSNKRNKETANLSSAPEVADTHALLWKRSKVDLKLKAFAVKVNSFLDFAPGATHRLGTIFFPSRRWSPRDATGVDRVHDFNQRVGSTRGAHVTLGL